MMKLSKRILDLVRAGIAAPPKLSGLGKERSPERLEAQLERIRKSLVQATGREKRLQEELAMAEQEGRERDAVRLRRELADLTRSSQELQSALDLIEARIEMERQSQAEAGPVTSEGSLLAEEATTPHASLADVDGQADLVARKTRLAAPDDKRGTTGTA
jgi:hypothetical protein